MTAYQHTPKRSIFIQMAFTQQDHRVMRLVSRGTAQDKKLFEYMFHELAELFCDELLLKTFQEQKKPARPLTVSIDLKNTEESPLQKILKDDTVFDKNESQFTIYLNDRITKEEILGLFEKYAVSLGFQLGSSSRTSIVSITKLSKDNQMIKRELKIGFTKSKERILTGNYDATNAATTFWRGFAKELAKELRGLRGQDELPPVVLAVSVSSKADASVKVPPRKVEYSRPSNGDEKAEEQKETVEDVPEAEDDTSIPDETMVDETEDKEENPVVEDIVFPSTEAEDKEDEVVVVDTQEETEDIEEEPTEPTEEEPVDETVDPEPVAAEEEAADATSEQVEETPAETAGDNEEPEADEEVVSEEEDGVVASPEYLQGS
eukprot:CAMPEP_0168527796 /NCGR_PEP_ID=MMETSP0405-20121227/12843_1 /TAXON_ID=498012 /ORGANISM="Trichosphaerium sp, Strain Am-I-7 wt" /LENGTH=376 /DNA_ID=CAMNT_0008551031 /DNA_START=238 /DNA_END=1365 /DNA_ORIENTATION=+